MKNKRVILFIVEGISDQEALEALVEKIFQDDSTRVITTDGDITSADRVDVQNVIKKIWTIIVNSLKRYSLNPKDLKGIIHIVDTDGAYIPNDNIIEDKKYKECYYTPEHIHTDNKNNIEKRNKQKSSVMNRLYTNQKIRDIPYKLFYMSSNLDHVLYNKQNNDDSMKYLDAHSFVSQYKDNIRSFILFISSSEFSVNLPYNESWEYIKQDLHSLERHTNLGIIFQNRDCGRKS